MIVESTAGPDQVCEGFRADGSTASGVAPCREAAGNLPPSALPTDGAGLQSARRNGALRFIDRNARLISDIGMTAVGAAFAFQALTEHSFGLLAAALVCLAIAGIDPARILRRGWVGSHSRAGGGGCNGPAGDSRDGHSLASRPYWSAAPRTGRPVRTPNEGSSE